MNADVVVGQSQAWREFRLHEIAELLGLAIEQGAPEEATVTWFQDSKGVRHAWVRWRAINEASDEG